MSGQPSAPEAETDLLRRVINRGLERDGSIKAICFNLRVKQEEKSLSFYRAGSFEPAALLAAPGSLPGMGVVSIRVAQVEEVGFGVTEETDEADPVFGQYHVAAVPPEYDDDGQIPLDLRISLASKAVVVIATDPKAKG